MSATTDLEAASRTLGFWPLPSLHHQLECSPPNPANLIERFRHFLGYILHIPETTIEKMQVNRLFKEENENFLFIEFTADREVNTVFKFINNLPKDYTIVRYIPPCQHERFNALSERAYKLRKCEEKYQTKIKYDSDSLSLYFKKSDDLCWTLDLDPLSIPSASPSSCPDSIPQVDGFSDSLSIPTSHCLPQKAPYFLNQDKQTERICKDASVSDMNIVVNNRDTNVNVQCSSGFYIVVLKPVMSSINVGLVCQYPPIQVTCTEVVNITDQAGVPDFTRVSFNLKGPLGSVCIHFRHTTRLVQVQGSAKMHDKTTAAVWFTEHFLSNRFQKLAKVKQYDISSFNERVLEMSRNHHNTIKTAKFCFQCDKLLSAQSRPTLCSSCQQYVHRICVRPHSISCQNLIVPSSSSQPVPTPQSTPQRPEKRPRTCTSTPLTASTVQTNDEVQTFQNSAAVQPCFMSSLTTSLVNSGIATFTGARTRISFVPQTSSPALLNTPRSSSFSSLYSASTVEATSSLPVCSTTAALTAPQVTAAPSGPSTQSGGIALQSSASTTSMNVKAPAYFTKQVKPPPNKKKGKEAQSSAEKTQIEYLTTELNYTHSKIVLQDNTIKDLEYKVKIQAERIRISEEKLKSDMHGKYFGLPESSVNPLKSCCCSPCHVLANQN